MAEVPQQPPQPLRAAHLAVRDHKYTCADPGPRGGLREALGAGQRMTARSLDGQVGKVFVHVEKRGARNVPREIELTPSGRVTELPAAIDELVAHRAIVTRQPSGGVQRETARRQR